MSIQAREIQIRALALAVRNNRCVLISPTASGKSLIAYLITRYYNVKTLIVVPTISLVKQLQGDFKDYGYMEEIHGITGGVDKNTNLDITCSTWQSIFNQDEEFFEQFGLIIGDEAHNYKAKSLISIMTKMKNTKYRFGMTGTLNGAECDELTLTGLFGPVENIVSTSSLIDSGILSPLKIKILVLKHDKMYAEQLHEKSHHVFPETDSRVLAASERFRKEIEHLISNEDRNRFIRNLAVSLKGNTLILYAYVDKHGKLLYDMIDKKSTHDNVFFVSGSVSGKEREKIRHNIENLNSSITIASYGTFSTGINIPSLNNIIFASPTKSRIRTMQSIGRGLRLSEGKLHCTLFDIADDLTFKNKKNHTLNHLIERVKMYNSENFPYDIHTIKIGKDK